MKVCTCITWNDAGKHVVQTVNESVYMECCRRACCTNCQSKCVYIECCRRACCTNCQWKCVGPIHRMLQANMLYTQSKCIASDFGIQAVNGTYQSHNNHTLTYQFAASGNQQNNINYKVINILKIELGCFDSMNTLHHLCWVCVRPQSNGCAQYEGLKLCGVCMRIEEPTWGGGWEHRVCGWLYTMWEDEVACGCVWGVCGVFLIGVWVSVFRT